MSWVLCSSGAAISKAGANADTTIVASFATLADWSNKAEANINFKTRHDWTTGFSTLNTNFKEAINDAVSDDIALRIINYNMRGYTTGQEAQTMLNFLTNHYDNIIKDLREKVYQEVF